jgi:Mg/Co/Ni transporter MgtE
MAVLVTFTIGLIWWICAWSFGIKAFDAFLLTVFITVVAATFVIIKPFLDQLLRREPASFEERGAAR